MNYFKNIALVMIMCSLGFVNAKRMAQAIQPNTFSALVQFIKIVPNIWQTEQNKFSQEFINDLAAKAQAANLKNFQLDLLLDMARDYRAPFTGNSDQDLIIVNRCNLQKENMVQNYARSMGQPVQARKEVRSPGSDESQVSNADIEAFVEQLINADQNKINLQYFADQNYLWRHGYTSEIFSQITSEVKKQYPNPEDQAKAKSILINKVKENSPGISKEGERWGQMLQFINLNIPYEQKPTKETVPSEEPQAQEPQPEPYSAEATKGKQSSQPDKDITADVEQVVEENRTHIEDFIKMESFNSNDTFEVFAPITSALKNKYPDAENQKKLKPILIETIKKLFPDQIGKLKMGSIYKVLNDNLP